MYLDSGFQYCTILLPDLCPHSAAYLACALGRSLEASQGDVMVHPLAPVFILRGVPFSALAAETL